MITAYISIGNSDDKLTQRQWAAFLRDLANLLGDMPLQIHGAWYSAPTSDYQNACWCVEVAPEVVPSLQRELRDLARVFRQDSIAWAEVAETEFLTAGLSAPGGAR